LVNEDIKHEPGTLEIYEKSGGAFKEFVN